MLTQRTAPGTGRRLPSSGLSGTSCWQANGHEAGANTAPTAATWEPWCGDPSVTTRRATREPPSSVSQIRVTTPPAE